MGPQVQFSDDGKQVISSCLDDSVRFWDVSDGRQVSFLISKFIRDDLPLLYDPTWAFRAQHYTVKRKPSMPNLKPSTLNQTRELEGSMFALVDGLSESRRALTQNSKAATLNPHPKL